MARTPRITGAFHGAMPSTTPAGWRTAIATEPGTFDGITSPLICVVMAAASSSMSAARCTLKPAQMPDAPVSAAIAWAKASALASSAWAAFISRARRAPGPLAAQAGKACAAASTAATASATVAAGAVVATVWSSGLRRSNVAPLDAARGCPPISMEMGLMVCLLSRCKALAIAWQQVCATHPADASQQPLHGLDPQCTAALTESAQRLGITPGNLPAQRRVLAHRP